MKRKQLVILGCSMMILVTLAGCGKGAKSKEAQESAKGSTTDIVTIEDEMVPEAAVPHRIEDTVDERKRDTVVQETQEVLNELTAAPGNPLGVQEDLLKQPSRESNIEENNGKIDTSILTNQVIERINAIRTEKGISSLSTTPQLMTAAGTRAGEIAGKFSHARPDGSDFCTALDAAGAAYGYAGENVFSGFSTIQSVEQAWNQSQNHLLNILDGNYHHIGVGCVQTDQGVFLTQIFTD